MNLQEISYPVFRLRAEKPSEYNGVLFYAYDRVTEEGDIEPVIRILDDRNLDNPKLSMRRLILKTRGEKLFKLTKAIFFLGDLIKIAKKGMWFIDSNGKIFEYIKTTSCKLKYHKITKVIPVDTGGAIIEVEGISSRFKSLFYPEPTMLYAGILHFGMSPILYGYYDKKYKDTRRMV